MMASRLDSGLDERLGEDEDEDVAAAAAEAEADAIDNEQFREQHAVKIIQRYYRGYKLRKDFDQMRADKRCSRRLDLGSCIVADMSDSAVDVTALSIDQPPTHHQQQQLQHSKPKKQQRHNHQHHHRHEHRHNSLDDILVGNDEAFLAWQRSLQPLGGGGGVSGGGGGGSGGDGDSPGQDSGIHSSEQLVAAAASSTPSRLPAHSLQLQHQRPPLVKRCHSCSAAAAAAAAASVDFSSALPQKKQQQQPQQQPTTKQMPPSASAPAVVAAVSLGNGGSSGVCRQHPQQQQPPASYAAHYSHNDRVRKRTYRIGLNFFNRKPDKGIQFLIGHHFIQNSPSAVARFLLHRKGLCKQVISNYLGQCHASTFVNRVCDNFLTDFDFAGKPLDIALREFLQFIEIKGEAQVVSRILEKFANRFIACNAGLIAEKFQDSDVIHLLVFAVMMLNTDLHNMNNKKKITLREFVHNLRGCDSGSDLTDTQMLADLYERIRAEPLRAGSDHVTQVLKMEAQLYGRHPPLAEPHRRLVCFCKLSLVKDWKGQTKPRQSERAVFLFNDLLIVTKCLERKRRVFYQYRGSLGLHRMQVSFSVPDRLQLSYPIHIVADPDGCDLDAGGGCHHDMVFAARNFHDRSRFCDDLVESIHEVGDMRRCERALFAEPAANAAAPVAATQHHQQQHHPQQPQQQHPPACHHPPQARRTRSSSGASASTAAAQAASTTAK